MTHYTPEQIGALAGLVPQVIAGVMGAGGAGPIGSLREVASAANFLNDMMLQFPNNVLIHRVLEIARELDGEMLRPETDSDYALNQIAVDAGSIATDDEGDEFKALLIGLGERVAGAAGGGLFGGGAKVSAGETAFLDRLRAALQG